jgi:CMP-N-acetylneuraminic acid synthetase
VNTLILHEADSVVSVCEDTDLHFVHGPHGLTPLNPAMHRQIRLEREGLYESNGAVRALWRRVLTEQDLSGQKVGHIVMPKSESFQIKNPFDLELMEHLLQQRTPEGKALDAARR